MKSSAGLREFAPTRSAAGAEASQHGGGCDSGSRFTSLRPRLEKRQYFMDETLQ